MNYGNQDYGNRENRGQRDHQRYDSERNTGRRGEESYDERGFERGSYAGRYGFRGDPEAGPQDYEREDRFSAHPSRPGGGRNSGPEDRGDAREWGSPRQPSGYSSRFSYTPDSGRDGREEESGMRGGSYGGSFGGGSEAGRFSGQGSSGQGGYGSYGSGRESPRAYGGRQESESRGSHASFPESWQGASSRGTQDRSASDWSTPGRMSSTGQGAGTHHGKGPKGYRRNDERIKEDVCEALKHDHDVDATEITCQVREGIVTLTGEVDSRRSKRAAEECVERLSGVEDVINQLRVGSKSESSASKRDGESSSSTQSSGSSSQSGSQSGSNSGKRPETSSSGSR